MDPSKNGSSGSKTKPSRSDEKTQIAAALIKLTEEVQKINVKMEEEKKGRSEQLKEIVQEINSNFAKYALDLNAVKEEIDQLHAQTKKMDGQMTEIRFKHEQQDKRLCILEQEVRRANIIIIGIFEERIDSLKQRVLNWLNELGLEKKFIATDLISVFRIGYRRQNGRMRNVLVKFANVADKLQVMTQIREQGDAALKFESKQIQVFQDISKEERSWRYYLKPITKVLRDKGIRYNWRPPQQLKFFYRNKMHTFTPHTEAVEYLTELGLLEKEEEQNEMFLQLLKLGGMEKRTSTPEEEGGAVGGSDPKLKSKRKRKPTKDTSPSLTEIQKKSRDATSEGVEIMDSEHESEDESECEDEED